VLDGSFDEPSSASSSGGSAISDLIKKHTGVYEHRLGRVF